MRLTPRSSIVMFRNMRSNEFEVQGQWPSINGEIVDALLCQEYYYEGALAEPANVIYFKVGSVWHRLTLDCGVIFWRREEVGPEAYAAPEINAEYKIIDLGTRLGIVGSVIITLEPSPVPGGVGVSVLFSNGRRTFFKNQDDVTTYET